MARLPPREQGDLGEQSALVWLLGIGATVGIPFGHSPDYDLIADMPDGRLLRVQVKTTTQWRNGHRWALTVCTRGGNRSWNGVVKRFNASRCDWLFALVADGRRWFIPATVVEGGNEILLGGPKYAEFEIAPGLPLPTG
jgi:hypothetical protein